MSQSCPLHRPLAWPLASVPGFLPRTLPRSPHSSLVLPPLTSRRLGPRLRAEQGGVPGQPRPPTQDIRAPLVTSFEVWLLPVLSLSIMLLLLPALA